VIYERYGRARDQLVDEADLDRCRGQPGAADRDVLIGRVERRSGLLGHRCLGEPGVALNAVKRAAEDDLRDRAPHVGERGPELVVAHRRIRLPHQHGLVQPAAAQTAAELACLRDVETKLLVVRGRPPERALAAGDKAVHRDTHRVDQHGFTLIGPERRTMIAMTFTIELDIGLSFLLQAALPQLVTDCERRKLIVVGDPSDRTAIADAALRSRKRNLVRATSQHRRAFAHVCAGGRRGVA
jgi:hypothetical protein